MSRPFTDHLAGEHRPECQSDELSLPKLGAREREQAKLELHQSDYV